MILYLWILKINKVTSYGKKNIIRHDQKKINQTGTIEQEMKERTPSIVAAAEDVLAAEEAGLRRIRRVPVALTTVSLCST